MSLWAESLYGQAEEAIVRQATKAANVPRPAWADTRQTDESGGRPAFFEEPTMHDTSDQYLLQIEPDKDSEPSTEPVDDDITDAVKYILSCAGEGPMYRGFHVTKCGKASGCCDLILPNGMVTNSLALYYIRYYRHAIPEEEFKKISAIREKMDPRNIGAIT